MSARAIIVAAVGILVGWMGTPLAAQEESPTEEVPVMVGEGVSPTGAFVRSLVLPGWGQLAAGSPHRGAVYFAVEAGSIWMTVKSRQRLRDVRTELRILEAGLGEGEALPPEVRTPLETIERQRENQVEDWMAIAIFTAFLSAADALVAAYLQGFDEHLAVGVTEEAAVSVGVRIPFGSVR